MAEFNLEKLEAAISGKAAAFRCLTKLQPAGGVGDKVFPPTYAGGKYATETRIVAGTPVPCVLLDSVQSQANRMELVLLDAVRGEQMELPLIEAQFNDDKLKKKFTVTSLDAPHRAADAIFRDSLFNGMMFRVSEKGRILDTVDVSNATGLFSLCPTALLFGIWDSAGPRGGLGAKFQRAIVSEIVGINAIPGIATGGKVDTIPILKNAGTLYYRRDRSNSLPDWTLNESLGVEKIGKKKDGKPSEANLGGVTPDFAYVKDNRGVKKDENGVPLIKGGFTIDYALQTTVLSLTALRRLRFPLGGEVTSKPDVDIAARTLLAAIGLSGAVLMTEAGLDLRSRCQLVAEEKIIWQLLNAPGETPEEYTITGTNALSVFTEALKKAKELSLPWEGKITLQPSEELLQLVARSHELAASTGEAEEEN